MDPMTVNLESATGTRSECRITRDQKGLFVIVTVQNGESTSNTVHANNYMVITIPLQPVTVHRVGMMCCSLKRCSTNWSLHYVSIYRIFTQQAFLREDCFRTKLDRVCHIFLRR